MRIATTTLLLALAATVATGPASGAPAKPAKPATNVAATPAAPATPAPPPAPPYAVVQGAHTADANPFQKLTVFCPAHHRAFGAGFTAVVHPPAQAGGAKPADIESGLDHVRSLPNDQGTGWQVEGVSPDAARLKAPWQLVVRIVCVQIAGA